MTLIALTECCRLLGIDGKTLRRWLTQAQLPVQAHPGDARCKGLARDHLLLLARDHHRCLTGLPQELAALAGPRPPEEPPSLPAELLALLPTLTVLPAQIAALQQQLAELTALLQPPQPAVTMPKAQRQATRGGAPTPTRASARARRATSSRVKRPAPSVPVLALIEYGSQGTYVVICPTRGLLPLEPDSPAWFAELSTLSSFRFVGKCGRFTAHREVERLPRAAWRAHRSMGGHTSNLHLGSTQSLTIATLEQAAATLHAHLT